MSNDTPARLWKMYEDGLAYQSKIGLTKNIPEFVKFWEGKQWAPAGELTKNIPRPVVNMIKSVCRSKKAAILANRVRLVFESDSGADMEKLNRFTDYICKEISQHSLDKKAVDDGVKKGPYFYHYYWDAEARGKDGVICGGVRCEIIDALSIFFANPTECDEQKQKWILIVSREDVSAVRAKCDTDEDPESIKGDEDKDNPYGTVEQDGESLCTVLTRYFRKDGEVYFERATKSAVVNKPKPIAPDIKAARLELGYDEEDAPNDNSPDGEIREKTKSRAYLYPIVAGVYEIREKCIYGIGEIEGLTPNQKAINFNLAMLLLNSQENAWGKYLVHPAALRGQTITNKPGQVITDYTKTMNGVRKMTEQTMQKLPLELVTQIMQMTRSATGATEVMSGEVLGSNMSGSAIAQLQAQAAMPIDDLRDNFREAKRKQGLVLAQFFRLFYNDKKFSYTEEKPVLDDAGKPQFDELGAPVLQKQRFYDTFSGSDYEDVELDVIVETTTGTKSSAAGDINILDMLLSKGLISLKTYLKAYPEDAISNKSEIIKGIEEDERRITETQKAQIAEYQNAIQQYQMQLQEATQILAKQKATVDNAVGLIQENSRLKMQIINLESEARAKIGQANAEIEKGNAKMRELQGDATAFAQHIAGGGGIPTN